MSGRYVKDAGAFVNLSGVPDLFGKPFVTDRHIASGMINNGQSTHATVAHSAGAWNEQDDALAEDCHLITILSPNAISGSGTDSSTVLEIATGGAGSEVVWAQVLVGYKPAVSPFIEIPGFIPSGTRVSFRVRGAILNDFQPWTPVFHHYEGITMGTPVSMGINTANSQGVTVPLPGAVQTKGAWGEIEDSTSEDFHVLAAYVQGAGSTALASGNGVFIDIGVGAAGSEVVIIPDWYVAAVGSSESVYQRSPNVFGVDIPAGSRLSARYKTYDLAHTIDVSLLGVGLS